MWFFSIHCSSWVLPPNQFRQKKNTAIIQSWIWHTHLHSSYYNHCQKSIKSVNPRSRACSTRHPSAKHWVSNILTTPKTYQYTSDRLKSQLESGKILCHHLRTIKVHWSLWQIAHKQPMGPNNVSGCWQVYLFNDKAPFSITRYPFKTKSAGKSSWYESAVSPAITLQIFYQVI